MFFRAACPTPSPPFAIPAKSITETILWFFNAGIVFGFFIGNLIGLNVFGFNVFVIFHDISLIYR